MKILAAIALVWLVCLAIGAAFGILGKIIWLAVLATAIGAAWKILQKDEL